MLNHIIIQQSNIDEYYVSSSVINKLYNAIIKNELYNGELIDMSNSNIIGEIYLNEPTYQEYIDKINEYFRHFKINASSLYIMFADNIVKQIIFEKYNISEGITISEAAAITGSMSKNIFQNNTEITSFDELKYFGWTTANWWYHDDGAFKGCSNLTTIDVSNFTELSNIMFLRCSSLKTIKNFNGNYIGYRTLEACTQLESVNLSNVTMVASGAFNGASKLNLKQNGLDFTKITRFFEGPVSAFNSCTGCGDANFISLRDSNNNTCKINHAFINCDVTSITGNTYFTSISDYNNDWQGAIENCSALTKIDFSVCTLVTSIKRHLCRNCASLKIIKLPSSITKIYEAPFGWQYLTSIKAIYFPVIIPPGVYADSDLKDTTPSGTFRFNSYAADLKIYVPDESVTTYKEHSQWSGWGDKIVPISQWITDYPND